MIILLTSTVVMVTYVTMVPVPILTETGATILTIMVVIVRIVGAVTVWAIKVVIIARAATITIAENATHVAVFYTNEPSSSTVMVAM